MALRWLIFASIFYTLVLNVTFANVSSCPGPPAPALFGNEGGGCATIDSRFDNLAVGNLAIGGSQAPSALLAVNGSGSGSGGIGAAPQNGTVASFIVTNNVTLNVLITGIKVHIEVNDPGQDVTYWVTNSLGPGTTAANEIATGDFTTTVTKTYALDTNFKLAAGTYYLTLAAVDQGNETAWTETNFASVVATSFVNYGDTFTTNGLAARPPGGFVPSFVFDEAFHQFSAVFEVDGIVETPEPSPMWLTFIGFAALLILKSIARYKNFIIAP